MKWFERSFTFGEPAGIFPCVVERLRGTPARLEERLAAHDLTAAPNADAWSIREHVGHLGDLEELWARRLDDFVDRRTELTPADLANRRTHEAGHEDRPIAELLARFRRARETLVAQLDSLSPADVERTALHPRLRQPMRLLDFAIFVAEHDDHHLAEIGALLAGSGVI